MIARLESPVEGKSIKSLVSRAERAAIDFDSEMSACIAQAAARGIPEDKQEEYARKMSSVKNKELENEKAKTELGAFLILADGDGYIDSKHSINEIEELEEKRIALGSKIAKDGLENQLIIGHVSSCNKIIEALHNSLEEIEKKIVEDKLQDATDLQSDTETLHNLKLDLARSIDTLEKAVSDAEDHKDHRAVNTEARIIDLMEKRKSITHNKELDENSKLKMIVNTDQSILDKHNKLYQHAEIDQKSMNEYEKSRKDAIKEIENCKNLAESDDKESSEHKVTIQKCLETPDWINKLREALKLDPVFLTDEKVDVNNKIAKDNIDEELPEDDNKKTFLKKRL